MFFFFTYCCYMERNWFLYVNMTCRNLWNSLFNSNNLAVDLNFCNVETTLIMFKPGVFFHLLLIDIFHIYPLNLFPSLCFQTLLNDLLDFKNDHIKKICLSPKKYIYQDCYNQYSCCHFYHCFVLPVCPIFRSPHFSFLTSFGLIIDFYSLLSFNLY